MDPPTFSPVDNSEATVVEWACKALNSGNHDFFIQGNHIDNIGENAMACFIHQLTVRIGRSVRIEYVDSQDLWHVMAPLEPVAPPARAITSVVRKKPPRPMNCFIMYRDHEYKRLKALHPELSVQRISQIVAHSWKVGGEELHDVWKEKARIAKEEHNRMYPGYRYTPRKPGEKRRRQSRRLAQMTGTYSETPGSVTAELFAREYEPEPTASYSEYVYGTQAHYSTGNNDFGDLINWNPPQN